MAKFNRYQVIGATVAVTILSIVVSGVPATAATISYSRVNVIIAGSDTSSINQCVRDAQDGTINTAINQCNQVATAGNSLVLRDADIIVYPTDTWRSSLYQSSGTTSTLSGGTTENVVSCVEDSRDGRIDYALADCRRALVPNTNLALADTDVEIDE